VSAPLTTNRTPSAAARDHCLAPGRVVDAPLGGGRYGRMFPELTALDISDQLLREVGGAGGPCECTHEVLAGVAAGWPFFGQFVAHDITADRSPLTARADVAQLRNVRSPRANLECVYGGGPVGSPYLFDRRDPVKLLVSAGGRDVPRNEQGTALIGDPRNDVHLFVNQLQVVMLRAHNLLVDRLRADATPEAELFDDARRALTWHYQWVLLHDFLPSLIGEEQAAESLQAGARMFEFDAAPFIPFEFADAAYRYGHSQIRSNYRVDGSGTEFSMFPDLIGFRPPQQTLDWSLVFDFPGRPAAQRAKRIDGQLPDPLIHLPIEITGADGDPDYQSLATRDLERGQGTALPAGEAVAVAIGAEPLTPEEVGLGDLWNGPTPLWFYILREADVRGHGDRLGPVGGRIVADTLVAIVDSDPESFRSVNRGWAPTLPGASPGSFGITDLIAAALAA
jgi:hypothetical protein